MCEFFRAYDIMKAMAPAIQGFIQEKAPEKGLMAVWDIKFCEKVIEAAGMFRLDSQASKRDYLNAVFPSIGEFPCSEHHH